MGMRATGEDYTSKWGFEYSRCFSGTCLLGAPWSRGVSGVRKPVALQLWEVLRG